VGTSRRGVRGIERCDKQFALRFGENEKASPLGTEMKKREFFRRKERKKISRSKRPATTNKRKNDVAGPEGGHLG